MSDHFENPRRNLRTAITWLWVIGAIWLPIGLFVGLGFLANIATLAISIPLAIVALAPGVCLMICAAKSRSSRSARLMGLVLLYLSAAVLLVVLTLLVRNVGLRDLIRGRPMIATMFTAVVVLSLGFHAWVIHCLTSGVNVDTALTGPHGFEAIPLAKMAPQPTPLPGELERRRDDTATHPTSLSQQAVDDDRPDHQKNW